jgi:hypothetical protein
VYFRYPGNFLFPSSRVLSILWKSNNLNFDPLYSAADEHRTKVSWTRVDTAAVRFFLSSLLHNCYTWKLNTGRKLYPDPQQPVMQLIRSPNPKSDRGTQPLNPGRKSGQYSSNKRLCGPQRQSVSFGEKTSCLCREKNLGHPEGSLVTIPTTLSRPQAQSAENLYGREIYIPHSSYFGLSDIVLSV